MDEQRDKEEIFSDTQSGRRSNADAEETTKYPARRERPSVRSMMHTNPVETPAENAEFDWEQFLEETRLAQPRRQPAQAEYQPRRERMDTDIYRMRERRREQAQTGRIRSRADSRAEESGGAPRASLGAAQSANHAEPHAAKSAAHPPKKHKKKHKRRKLSGFGKGVIVLLIALLVGICCFRFMSGMMNPPEEDIQLTGQTVSVTIPEGSSTEDIAQILKENKLIGSVFSFKLTSKFGGFDGTYRQGTYEIDTGLTQRQMMQLLQSGDVAQQLTLAIPEGYTVRQIAEKVAETGLCTAEEFLQASNQDSFEYDFLKDLPEREYRLEGYLFPDTYFLSESMTAHDIVDMLLSRFERMYTEEYQKAVAESDYSLDEIVTIASMVEKEIKVEDERARAAGVMYNRLRDNIMLGIDATVLYAIGETAGELTQEDLNVDSPYNTRNRYGLPLGPISNPGEASFKAALYPEEHEYLYYVLEGAGKDNHIYCTTYDEFLAAKQAYQASLSSAE